MSGATIEDVRRFSEALGTDVRPSISNTVAPPCSGDQSPSPACTSGNEGVGSWAFNGTVYFAAKQTHNQLPAGVYRCRHHHELGPYFEGLCLQTDGLLTLPGNTVGDLMGEFDRFWASAGQFAKRGFLHKRGFMFWGPPGSGKTALMNLLATRLILERDGVVLFLEEPVTTANCMQLLRRVEPDRPLVVLMEDLDATVVNYGETTSLALLDGQAQVNSVVFLATTNYPERLDRRFCDRPSRFDTISFIGMPSAEARRAYLLAKEETFAEEPELLERWVGCSEGLSIAHLKEMVVAVFCLGHELDSAVARLRALHERKLSSEDDPGRVRTGFGLGLGNGKS